MHKDRILNFDNAILHTATWLKEHKDEGRQSWVYSPNQTFQSICPEMVMPINVGLYDYNDGMHECLRIFFICLFIV